MKEAWDAEAALTLGSDRPACEPSELSPTGAFLSCEALSADRVGPTGPSGQAQGLPAPGTQASGDRRTEGLRGWTWDSGSGERVREGDLGSR